MKKILTILLILISFFFILSPAVEAAYVRGYYRRVGTYVRPHYRSNPNGLLYDNYSWRLGQPLYNQSYGRYNTYRWNTPSWEWQSDYWFGLNSYRSYNTYRGWFSSSSYSSGDLGGSSLFDYNWDW